MNFLLTGTPGSGKTSLIREVIQHSPLPTCGFYTDEIRCGGRRRSVVTSRWAKRVGSGSRYP